MIDFVASNEFLIRIIFSFILWILSAIDTFKGEIITRKKLLVFISVTVILVFQFLFEQTTSNLKDKEFNLLKKKSEKSLSLHKESTEAITKEFNIHFVFHTENKINLKKANKELLQFAYTERGVTKALTVETCIIELNSIQRDGTFKHICGFNIPDYEGDTIQKVLKSIRDIQVREYFIDKKSNKDELSDIYISYNKSKIQLWSKRKSPRYPIKSGNHYSFKGLQMADMFHPLNVEIKNVKAFIK